MNPSSRFIIPRPGGDGASPLEIRARRHEQQVLRVGERFARCVPGKGHGLEDVAFHVA